jgi:hypothetical protein
MKPATGPGLESYTTNKQSSATVGHARNACLSTTNKDWAGSAATKKRGKNAK